MKKLLILLFGIIQFHNSYADPGNAYRYKIKLKLNNSENLTGYVYHYTYGKPYNSKVLSFCDYFISNFSSPPVIYLEIKTLKLNESFEIDFSLNTNKVVFNKEEIQNISLIREIEFPPVKRIHTLDSKVNYQYLDKTPLDMETVYMEWMENCDLTIVNWSEKENLSKLKSEIDKGINAFYNRKTEIMDSKINLYLMNLKKALSARNVILIYHCDVL